MFSRSVALAALKCVLAIAFIANAPSLRAADGTIAIEDHPRNARYASILITGDAAKALFDKLGTTLAIQVLQRGDRYVAAEGVDCFEDLQDGAKSYRCALSMTPNGRLRSPPTTAGIGVTN